MGAEVSARSYAVQAIPASDPAVSSGVWRSVESPEKQAVGPKKIRSTWHYFDSVVKRQPDRPYLGKRQLTTNGELGPYTYLSYGEAREQAVRMGSALIARGICEPTTFNDEDYGPCKTLRRLGMFIPNCPEWFISEQAAAAYDIAVVPMYDTLGIEALTYLIETVRMSTIVVTEQTLKIAAEAGEQCECLRNFIIVGPLNDELRSEVLARLPQAQIFLFNELAFQSADRVTPAPCSSQEAVNTICFTSGTTGKPKGVILTHGNLLSLIYAAKMRVHEQLNLSGESTYLSYLPLAHVFERAVACIVTELGGKVACYSGNLLKLVDDAAEAKPTVFVSVPRLLNRICDRVLSKVEEKPWVVAQLVQYGIESKRSKFRNTQSTSSLTWDPLFQNIRSILGGKVEFMISGGAPLEPKIQETLQALFSCPILQGYGMTETFGPCFLQAPGDPQSGSIGGIWPSCEFKIVAVPEMNYYTDSKNSKLNPDNGIHDGHGGEDPKKTDLSAITSAAAPYGELHLRGNAIFKGYFRDAERTREALDEEGWLHTGDICYLDANSKSICIVDRKKELFKLAQGEYLSPERVENVLGTCQSINQVFVTGDPNKHFPVAVVVVETGALKKYVNSLNSQDVPAEFKDLEVLPEHIEDADYKLFVLSEIEKNSREGKLNGFEIVRKIIIRTKEFSVENQMVTTTTKLRRNILREFYHEQLAELYDE